MANKNAEKDRKARVEEMRKAQQAAERRKNLLVVVASLAVVAVLVGVVFAVIRREQAAKDLANIGLPSAAAASCDPIITDEAAGGSVHVGPGTDQASKTTVEYKTVPPSSGEHYAQPAFPASAFYTADDRPRLEALVHNLEHGYSIVWYSESLPKAQQDELKRISELVRDNDENVGAGKFVVTAWDPARGAFPAGKNLAISHWGAKQGYRQFCGSVSGSVIKDFVAKYPYTDSPEPNAQ